MWGRVSSLRNRTVSTSEAGEYDLPHELNRFFGRERELRELSGLRVHARLLTLTGPGGVGKTRLAVRLAADARTDFATGVAYVDAAPIESADRLIGVVGASVGLRSARDADTLADGLGNRHMLLVLDNCSHLVGACAELVITLLSHCPRLQVIATSRERLGVPGETLWQVPPMATPEPGAEFEAIVASEAVRLLSERMIEVNPHFVLDEASAGPLADICRRLDGLPLALELAAGWINALSLTEIAERLDDPLRLLTRGARGAPARQQTLRATIEWSTAQLGERERLMLKRLGVFVGSWDLEAARAVCADDELSAAQVLPTLAELVGKSLVQVVSRTEGASARYRLLDVMRQHALEQLAASGELRTMHQRHARWCRSLVEAIPAGGSRPDQLDSLLREQDNLRAALNWAIAENDADLGFTLATRMHGVWYIQGQFGEARGFFDRLLSLPGGSALERTTVANWASIHALCQGDFAAAVALSEQARTTAAASGNPRMVVLGLDGWGTILLDQGKLDEAAGVFEQERDLLRGEASLDWLLACVDYRLAGISLERGNTSESERLCVDALHALGTDGNVWIRLRIERILGRIAFQRGDLETAAARVEASLSAVRQIGDLQGLVYSLIDLTYVAQARHQLPTARQCVREALQITERGSEPLVLARAVEAAAALLAGARPEGTLQLLSATHRLRARLGAPLWPIEQTWVDRTLDTAQARLGTGAAAVAMASGEVLRPEHAVRVARDLLDSLEASAAPGGPPHDVLTPREHAVAQLVGQGMTNRAIAQTLVISEGTVRAHVEHILSKLGVRSRTEIVERLEHAERTPSPS
jgi:predicted ATPase/DNA-binding CsgD family transcriptional regulator